MTADPKMHSVNYVTVQNSFLLLRQWDCEPRRSFVAWRSLNQSKQRRKPARTAIDLKYVSDDDVSDYLQNEYLMTKTHSTVQEGQDLSLHQAMHNGITKGSSASVRYTDERGVLKKYFVITPHSRQKTKLIVYF